VNDARPIPLRAPEQWLAVLRIAVGVWFAKSIFTKLTLLGGFVPMPIASVRWVQLMPKLLEKYAAGNPLTSYQTFLEGTVIPHASVFAQLTALGESAAGLLLVLGLLTELGAAVALLLVVCYYLAVFWQGASQQGFHYVLAVSLIVILGSSAGRRWGLDGWLARRRERRAAAQGTYTTS